MGEAVGHPVCGIPTDVDRKGALQFVVAGFVQKIADGNHTGRSSPEKDQLAGRPTLAERLCLGVKFSSSIAQVMVSNAKVHSFQHGVAGEKRFVGSVPKIVFSGNPRQILGAACTADEEHYAENMRYSAPSHEPNLGSKDGPAQIT
jgi:hypothetical protein